MATNLAVGIEKEHVMACDTTSLFLWQEKLTKTRQMMLEKRGKVEFWFQGWQDDPRELYEIQEIKDYFAATIRDGFPWIYWLEPDNLWVGYRLLFAGTGTIKISKADRGFWIEFDTANLKDWMLAQFDNLNQFTEANHIPISVNKELSENLMRFLDTQTGPIQNEDG